MMTPEKICIHEQCCGCSACMNICPHNAITMQANSEGFLYPSINQQLCVDCGLCQATCPISHMPELHPAIQVYSGWSSQPAVRLSSSSGGAFTEIARPVIESGGVVFGCGLDENLQATHMYVEDMKSLSENLSGSKYVQSKIGSCYQDVKKFLKEGRQVLFSGTPCQVAGLRKYLRKEYDNLLTVDIICHGVPSPMIFDKYKQFIEQTNEFKITDVKFRSKKSSWIFFNMALSGPAFRDPTKMVYYNGAYYEDPYNCGFQRDNFLRPSCYHCQFTRTDRTSDFTIADWWGYKKTNKEDVGFRYKGVSLLLVNTKKAQDILPSLNLVIKERSIEEAKKTNICLSHPFPMPKNRRNFWEDYKSMSFPKLIEKYMSPKKCSR